MKLKELVMEVYSGKKIRRGVLGPDVRLNADDHSLWYFSTSGEKIFPITFGDMLADDWHIVD
jgi:hypothetical protein